MDSFVVSFSFLEDIQAVTFSAMTKTLGVEKRRDSSSGTFVGNELLDKTSSQVIPLVTSKVLYCFFFKWSETGIPVE